MLNSQFKIFSLSLALTGIALGYLALGLTSDAGPSFVANTQRSFAAEDSRAHEFHPVSFQTQSGEPVDDQFKTQARPFIKKYCFECHSGEDSEGELDLAKFSTQADVDKELETWSQVLEQIEDQNMPPDGAKQPNKREIDRIKNWVLASLESPAAKKTQPLGKLRRLNRVEYENTIRELFRLTRNCFSNPTRILQTTDYFQPATGQMPRYVLGVSYFYNSHRRHSDLPGVTSLPVDLPVEHGFSNDQEALSLSPLLMETYLEISSSMLNNPEFAQISDIWDSMFTADGAATHAQKMEQGHEQIELFLPRAFRRKVTQEEISRYQNLFDIELVDSGSYTDAMKTTVSALLVSPNFLYRQEFIPTADASRSARDQELDENYAMANRLSYFLWASMPDDQLFQAARERRLTKPQYLERQVDRMMDDPKIKSLATDFGMQWLKVSKIASALPDKTRFPEYYKSIATMPPPALSMMIEQLLFFEAVMVENRSIQEFIASDFGYLNRQLMDWYLINPKTALGYTPALENFEDFFRVKWPNGHRGGVMSSGAMLISTSTTTRTSPVFRGAWILDVIFNSPPPPAPGNVPPLEPAEASGLVKLNVRDKLAQHRENPACASCHDRIDPMGFAFEMFDAVGRWRGKYDTGDKIDSTGEINGDAFEGSARFKNVILRDKSRFVRAFTEHTIKYALGRQLHFSDEPEIRRMTEEVIKQNCRFRSVIKQVVLSKMFRRFDD